MKIIYKGSGELNWQSDLYLYEKISNFLKENNITNYFDPFNFCREKDWHLIPYTNAGMDFFELMRISEDGFSTYENNEYYIFYNPYKYEPRINFTIAHEIGHIELLHHFFLPEKILMNKHSKSEVWEKHADLFAGNILLPAKEFKTLKDLGFRPYVDEKNYGVSNPALQTRWRNLDSDILMLNIVNSLS